MHQIGTILKNVQVHRTNLHSAQQENASSSSASSRNNIAAAGGGGGGGPGDSDSDDDDNNHNDSNNSPNNSANAASDGNINNRSRYTYFRTNDVYNGMRRFEAALNYDQSDFINVSDIGDLSEICTYCSSLRFPGEAAGMCCSYGKTMLPASPELPPLMKSLMTGHHPRSCHFMKNIKQYNCLYNFTSFGANERHLTDSRGNRLWSPGFCVQGQCYHSIGPMFPNSGSEHSYLQIYFMDNEEQTRRRLSLFDGLHPDIIRSLSDMLQTTNPFVSQFQQSADFMRRSNICGLRVSSAHITTVVVSLTIQEFYFTSLLNIL